MNIVRVIRGDDNAVHFQLGIQSPLGERMSRGSLFGSMLVWRK